MSVILKGFDSNGEIRDVKVTTDGKLIVSGSGGGGGGGDASAANQATQITEAQSTNTKLDSTISAIQNLLEIPAHSHYRLTYVASGDGIGQVETIRYYSGGTASETLLETRTFTYDSSDRVTLMEKS